jgi:hypothetical protein
MIRIEGRIISALAIFFWTTAFCPHHCLEYPEPESIR